MPELGITLNDPWLPTKEPDPPPPEGVSVCYYPMDLSLNARTIITTIVLTVTVSVPVNLLSAWLYEHLHQHGANSITVHGKKTTVEKPGIRLIIEEWTRDETQEQH